MPRLRRVSNEGRVKQEGRLCSSVLSFASFGSFQLCHYNQRRRELLMRVTRIVAAAFVLLVGRPVFAQEWDRYQNLDDRFAVTAPGQPAIEKTRWKSEYGSMVPETIYR